MPALTETSERGDLTTDSGLIPNSAKGLIPMTSLAESNGDDG